MRSKSVLVLGVVAFTFFVMPSVLAQTRVNEVPSTDVVEEGAQVRIAAFVRPYPFMEYGFQYWEPGVAFHVGKGVEAGVNFLHQRGWDPLSNELQPHLKWRLGEKQGFSVALGGKGFIPVNRKVWGNTFVMLYAVSSKQFRGKFGPRVSAGYYHLLNRWELVGSNKGALLAYEQPLGKYVDFQVDWFSGKNGNDDWLIDRFGYVTPALHLRLRKHHVIAGWKIGNQFIGNNGFFVAYQINF